MNLTISKILRTKRLNKNGEATLFFRFTSNRKSIYKSTSIRLLPKHWDDKKEKVKPSHILHTELNNFINEREIELTANIIANTKKRGSASFKTVIDEVSKRNFDNFFDLCEDKIVEYNTNGQIGTRDKAKAIVRKLKTYNKSTDLTLAEIDFTYLSKYENYCKKILKNSHNTVCKDMKFIRTVVNLAIKKGKITISDNPFIHYKIKEKQSNRVYLTKEELDRLRTLDLDKDVRLSKHRDMFIFACYSGGLRISDVLLLKWDNIIENRLNITFKKTNHKVSLPIERTARELLNKYKSENSTYVFNMIPEHLDMKDVESIDRAITSATTMVNKSLKRVGKLAKIDKTISSHISRHTFATLALAKKIPIEVVQSVLGHSNIRETQIYAKVINDSIEDAYRKFDAF